VPRGDESDRFQPTEKRYTLTLKDELLPTNETNGREQASISYECDFELPPQTIPGDATDRVVFIPWSSLNATYRGRLQPDAKPIDLEHVKRFSLMMRRYGHHIHAKRVPYTHYAVS
jgi:hypothetical protein